MGHKYESDKRENRAEKRAERNRIIRELWGQAEPVAPQDPKGFLKTRCLFCGKPLRYTMEAHECSPAR